VRTYFVGVRTPKHYGLGDSNETKQLREALRTWEFIFNNAGWAVAAVHPETNIIHAANPAFAEMHGYAPAELIGKWLGDTFAPESRDKLSGHAAAALNNGNHVYESLHIRKDGSVFPGQVDSFCS